MVYVRACRSALLASAEPESVDPTSVPRHLSQNTFPGSLSSRCSLACDLLNLLPWGHVFIQSRTRTESIGSQALGGPCNALTQSVPGKTCKGKIFCRSRPLPLREGPRSSLRRPSLVEWMALGDLLFQLLNSHAANTAFLQQCPRCRAQGCGTRGLGSRQLSHGHSPAGPGWVRARGHWPSHLNPPVFSFSFKVMKRLPGSLRVHR